MLISTKNAAHYLWGDECHGWWLKKEGVFTVISEMMPPHSAERKHLHKKTEQFFYCLSGTLTIEVEGTEYILLQHDGYSIAAGSAHKIKNDSQENVHFLVISCPNPHDDRIDLE